MNAQFSLCKFQPHYIQVKVIPILSMFVIPYAAGVASRSAGDKTLCATFSAPC